MAYKIKSFKHKGVKYTMRYKSYKDYLYNIVVLDGKVLGRVTLRGFARALWVQREGEDQFYVEKPKKGMARDDMLRHYLRWIADPEYVLPDFTIPRKVRSYGWQTAVLTDEEFNKI